MTKILAVVTQENTATQVLKFAVRLAQALKSSIHVFKPSIDSIAELNRYIGFDNFEEMKAQVVAQDRQWLDELMAKTDFGGASVSKEVVWSEKTYQGVLEQAEKNQCDFIVKAADVHHRLAEIVRTPDEWHLLRESKRPVFLVRDDLKDVTSRAIVAAVNPLEGDDPHHQLNQRVLQQAAAFAKALNTKLIVTCAIPFMTQSMPLSVDISIQYPNLQQELSANARKQLQTLLNTLNVQADEVIIENGFPEDVLHSVCDRYRSAFLVVGTVANKGLMNLMLGNTSERVVYHVDQSLLVVP